MSPNAVGLGQGHLDVLRPEGELLLVGGWYLPADGSAVNGLEVAYDGQRLEILEHRLAAPSPDIAVAFPGQVGADRARFFARVRLPGGAPKPDGWVQVIPRLAGPGERGFGLHALLAPSVAQPEQAAVLSIGGGYEVQALEFLRYFVDLCGLQREGHVLDVGCGIGRMAYGLVGYLTGRAQYVGFDVMAPAIATARTTIGAGRPRFRFEHVDLANLMYHAAGGGSASTFAFPVPDRWADLVILTSVLTHLRAPEVRHYLAEIGRTLARDGRALVTVFEFDTEVERLVAAGRSKKPFFAWEGCWTIDKAVPEEALGYARHDLERWVAEAGLRIERRVPGTWCGRLGGLSFQDLLVLAR